MKFMVERRPPFIFALSGGIPGEREPYNAVNPKMDGLAMKMDEKGRLWLVFCAAAVCGLLLPGWIGAAGIPGMELAEPAAMQGWTVLDDWRGKLAAGLLKSRLLPALVLYFAAFTAAGFWMLAGACLIFGLSLGILLSLSAMQMGWMGLLFLACALLPQWLFYGMAGSRIADLVKRKREQAALCPAGPARDSRWKIVKDFLGTAGAVCCGIGSEMLLNPLLLRLFLKFS